MRLCSPPAEPEWAGIPWEGRERNGKSMLGLPRQPASFYSSDTNTHQVQLSIPAPRRGARRLR